MLVQMHGNLEKSMEFRIVSISVMGWKNVDKSIILMMSFLCSFVNAAKLCLLRLVLFAIIYLTCENQALRACLYVANCNEFIHSCIRSLSTRQQQHRQFRRENDDRICPTSLHHVRPRHATHQRPLALVFRRTTLKARQAR